MKSEAKRLNNVTDLGNIPSQTILGSAMVTNVVEIIDAIKYWRDCMQNATDKEKIAYQDRIITYENILTIKGVITESILGATVNENDEVTEPKVVGNMAVVHNATNTSGIKDLFDKWAISTKFSSNVYEELLNIDALMSLLIDDKSDQTTNEKAIQAFFFDAKRPFTAEAVRGWDSKIMTAVAKNEVKGVKISDHYSWLYGVSKINPHKGELVNNPIKTIEDIVSHMATVDWDDVYEELKYTLVGSTNPATKNCFTLDEAGDFAKKYIAQYIDKNTGKEEKTKASLNKQTLDKLVADKVNELGKEELIESIINSLHLNTDDSGKYIDPLIYIAPNKKGAVIEHEIRNPKHLHSLLSKEYESLVPKEKAKKPEKVKGINLIKLSHLEELILNSAAAKKEVIHSMVQQNFKDEKNNLIVSDIIDDLNNNEVYRHVTKEEDAVDTLYKLYKVVKKNAAAVNAKSSEGKEEWNEPVLESFNEMLKIGKDLHENHGYTMEDLKKWAIKNLLNKKMTEQAENAVFHKEEEIRVFTNGMFSSLFEDEKGKSLESAREGAIKFLETQKKNGTTPKVNVLTDRLSYYFDEQKVAYKQIDLMNIVKKVFPELFKKAEKAKTLHEKAASSPLVFLTEKANERINENKDDTSEGTLNSLKEQSIKEKWPENIKALLEWVVFSDEEKKRILQNNKEASDSSDNDNSKKELIKAIQDLRARHSNYDVLTDEEKERRLEINNNTILEASNKKPEKVNLKEEVNTIVRGNPKASLAQVRFILRKKSKSWPADLKAIIADDNMDKIRSIFAKAITDLNPPSEKTKENNSKESEEKSQTTESKESSKDSMNKIVEKDTDLDEKDIILTEKFSTSLPAAWKKVKQFTTLEQLKSSVKFISDKKDWKTALSMVLEVIENGNILETKEWNEADAIEFINNVVEIKESSPAAKKSTESATISSGGNEFKELGNINDKGKFKRALREIVGKNEDTEEIRNKLITAIKVGKGVYVRKLPRKDDNALNAMLSKAYKDIEE